MQPRTQSQSKDQIRFKVNRDITVDEWGVIVRLFERVIDTYRREVDPKLKKKVRVNAVDNKFIRMSSDIDDYHTETFIFYNVVISRFDICKKGNLPKALWDLTVMFLVIVWIVIQDGIKIENNGGIHEPLKILSKVIGPEKVVEFKLKS